MSKSALIWLPYFKQGDDLHSSIVKNSETDKVDAKATLLNHIELLQSSIDMLKKIHDEIPLINDVELEGDTHHIDITGDERLIKILLEKELVQKCDEFSDNDSEVELEKEGENLDNLNQDTDSEKSR